MIAFFSVKIIEFQRQDAGSQEPRVVVVRTDWVIPLVVCFKNYHTSLKKNRILMFVIVDGGTSSTEVLKKYHNKYINIQQVH